MLVDMRGFGSRSIVFAPRSLARQRRFDCRHLPTMVDEAEEVVDPKPALEELAKARCIKQWFAYKSHERLASFGAQRTTSTKECAKQIEEDTSGHKHCTGQYFDYWACVDKYVAKRLFEFLK